MKWGSIFPSYFTLLAQYVLLKFKPINTEWWSNSFLQIPNLIGCLFFVCIDFHQPQCTNCTACILLLLGNFLSQCSHSQWEHRLMIIKWIEQVASTWRYFASKSCGLFSAAVCLLCGVRVLCCLYTCNRFLRCTSFSWCTRARSNLSLKTCLQLRDEIHKIHS